MRISRSIPKAVTAIILLVTAAASPGISAGVASDRPPSHSQWNAILQKYTENGLVDYSGLKKDSSVLDAYLALLTESSAAEADYESWSREEQMAFWINAYNAVTIHGILINYPIQPGGFFARRRFPQSSIRQIKDFWKTEFIELAGRPVTLDGIEHEILRREFADPRIHFSIVCASIGCPVLYDRAYTAGKVNEQLAKDAIRFIADPEKVHLDRKNNILYISEIFKWYKDDFNEWEKSAWEEFTGVDKETAEEKENKPDPPAWLNKYGESTHGFVRFIVDYAPADISKFIVVRSPKLKYIEYDWTLNEKYTGR